MLRRTPMFSHGKHGSAGGLKPIRVPGELRCVVLASLLWPEWELMSETESFVIPVVGSFLKPSIFPLLSSDLVNKRQGLGTGAFSGFIVF